jgi:hypothetical protein
LQWWFWERPFHAEFQAHPQEFMGVAWRLQVCAEIMKCCLPLPVVVEDLVEWHLEERVSGSQPQWLFVVAEKSKSLNDMACVIRLVVS